LGKIKETNIPGEFIREGLTAVISVKVPEPEFEGQTKTRLGNPEVRQVVDIVVSEALQTLFDWKPQVLIDICSKAMDAQSAALAAKAARDMVCYTSYIFFIYIYLLQRFAVKAFYRVLYYQGN
jgi:DNA gyrase subunit B